ncbi:MAG: VOC family protein [Candidatus Neomarinimicrobiota bacterium]
MARVVHFEIGADDPEKIVNFYRSVFDWTIEKWDGPMEYWLVMTGDTSEPGIDGGIGRRTESWDKIVNTISVESVEEYVKKIESLGGTIIRPKSAIPGVGYLAYCMDPDGNPFGIMQDDQSAE